MAMEESTTNQSGLNVICVPNPIPEIAIQQLLADGWTPMTTFLRIRQSTAKEQLNGAPRDVVDQVTAWGRYSEDAGTDED